MACGSAGQSTSSSEARDGHEGRRHAHGETKGGVQYKDKLGGLALTSTLSPHVLIEHVIVYTPQQPARAGTSTRSPSPLNIPKPASSARARRGAVWRERADPQI